MSFEYESEELHYVKELLHKIMNVTRDTTEEVDLLVEALDYLQENGYPCGC